MTNATDEAASVDAPATTPAFVTNCERVGMVDDVEEESTAVARERGNSINPDDRGADGGDNASELLNLMRGLAGRLERLEESQSKLEKKIDGNERAREAHVPSTPPMNSSLFATDLGRGAWMHIDSLAGSTETSYTATPRRPAAPPQYFGQQQPGYGMLLSHLQRLYAAAAQGGQPAMVAPQQQDGQTRAGTRHFSPANQNPKIPYPDARQKKLSIRPFDGKELYVGLGSGFLEWGRRFERQVNIAQLACGFPWTEDIKVDLLGHYLAERAERYYHKQVEAWWGQLPTLQYVMERMLEAFKTNITPAQAMKLFTEPKETKRTWPEHYMYLVAVSEACGRSADYLVLNSIAQYASADLRTVLMAKVDNTRTDYLQQAEELAHFAQAWELEPTGRKNLGKEVVAAVGERRKETRRCHECNKVGHLRAVCPERGRGREREPGLTLALRDERGNESWLDEVELCDDTCLQPNGEPLNVTKRGTLTLRVTACGREKILKLTDVYFAAGVVHNLISYGKLDDKGYTLTYRNGRCVVAGKNGGTVAFDVGLRRNVLIVQGKVDRPHDVVSDVIMAALEGEANVPDGVHSVVQKGTLMEFHNV
ncbi:hypothetical protein F442_10589 [Phytophthora nicotianae P10297]|uniref:CCHC-type domain-containing protein n=1 Tax=Phytophthora nicotianae P10297 TaxID=1317064 RepID=W2Z6A7_PHYNI|nr:hypothetical protein F442_10589 [Phytophthora nicotianae P10297]